MDCLIKFAAPFALDTSWLLWVFLLTPAVLSALGAFVFQGSFLRILGAAVGGVTRDFFLLLAVAQGWIEVTNPFWIPDISVILAFFCLATAALGACLAPYRGPLLYLNAGIGGFAGQFLLQYLIPTGAASPALTEKELMEKLF